MEAHVSLIDRLLHLLISAAHAILLCNFELVCVWLVSLNHVNVTFIS